MELNELTNYLNQKYKPLDRSSANILCCKRPMLRRFPSSTLDDFRDPAGCGSRSALDRPFLSLLEDNFDVSFAGMYESVFCPNQGTPEENLRSL